MINSFSYLLVTNNLWTGRKMMTDRLEWQFFLADNSKMVFNFNLLHLKKRDSYFQTFIQYKKTVIVLTYHCFQLMN